MKKIILNKSTLVLFFTAVLIGASCTKLEPQLGDAPTSIAPIDAGGAPSAGSVSKVYEQLNQLLGQGNSYAMQEHSTDEILGPTRGTDWDDFGTWRKLHLHTWDGAHNQVFDTWNGLNGALYQTTLLAESTTASALDQAVGKFLRAYFSYMIVDLYGQLQHRPATAAIADLPEVYTRSEAIDYVISELESVVPILPAYTHALRNVATKEAAQFLLAKCYLNKAVFKQDPNSPQGPYTFDAADMNKVIALCNAIATNPALSVAANYWDNFTWTNGTTSTENIFVRNVGIETRWATFMGAHYNMAPSGWNGFTTLADFYNSFEAGDTRKGVTLPGYTDKTGYKTGFLVGQIQGPKDGKIGNPIVDLKDRSGNPLIFTPDVSLFFSTESKGIRTNKYPLDPATINDGGNASKNEYVFFRFSDVRLMKAEAILRSGTDAAETPLAIVNEIRVKRNAAPFASIDLPKLLAERGRELYLETWRRNDMIRFGVFNAPVGERPNASDGTRCVYPIPNISLSSNPNLHQNVGY
jgi:starch-binding outer membrane protein, SusD/RagB family